MNKIRIIIVSVLLGYGNTGYAVDSQQELFLQANESYKKQDYKAAYDKYRHLDTKSSVVEFNLGNCAFKLGRKGEALLHWRRAENDWGLFHRYELIDNIALVKNELEVNSLQKDVGGPSQRFFHVCDDIGMAYSTFVRSIPLLFLQLLFLGVWGFLFLYSRYLYRRHHRFIMVVLFFLLAGAGGMLATKYGALHQQQGVVISEGRLYSGPGESYQFLGSALEGQEVSIKRETEDYFKVKIGAITGWLHKKHLGKI